MSVTTPTLMIATAAERRTRPGVVLAMVCSATALVVGMVAAVNLAVPMLASGSLHPSAPQLLWIVDAYVVLFACLVIPGGALGDRLGRKGVLLTGLVVFAAGAAASAAAPTATVMLVGRAVSGIGAACVLPNTLAVLLHATPKERRSTAIGVWASTTGVGGVIGNVGGGAVLSSGSWRWLFISIVPLSLVCALLIAAFVPRSSRADRTLQPVSATLLTAATVVLLIGIIQGPQSGWASWQVLGSVGVAVLLFGAWIACELRAAHPMLDPRLFRIPLLRGAALGTMVIFFAMFALFYVNASYLQYSKNYGVLRTGFAVLPLAVIMIVVARLASSFSGWIGRQGTDALAFGLVGVGLLLLSNCGTSTSYLVYASYLLVVGAGLALALPGLAADITSSLPPEQAGVSSGLQSTTRELGSALGVAVVGTVMTARFTAGLPAGLTNGAGGIPHTVADALSLAHTDQLRIALVQDFTHSVDIGLRVMGIVTLLAGLLVLAQLRHARAHCVGTAAGLRG